LSKKEISICRKKKLQIKNPYPFARKELAYFSASFRSRPPLFHFVKTRPAFAPLRSKRLTLSFALPPFYPLLQRRIKTKMKSVMIIFLLKYYYKVSQRSETLATAQGPVHAKDYAIKPLRFHADHATN